jgi:DNA-binding transcriptional MerR regulator
MLSIGDFSQLGQVTVRALHVYDKLGLLKPAHVDESSGYRYYAASQLSRLNRILVLKGMGFSLEQITRLLEDDLPAEQLRGMFMMKQAEIEQQVQESKTQLERVAMRLRQIEQEGQLPDYEVILKSIEPLVIASARQVVPAREEIPYYRRTLFGLVHHWLKQAGVEPPGLEMTIYHSTEYVEQEADIEAAVVLEPHVLESSPSPVTANGDVTVRELPAVEQMVSVVHLGNLSDREQALFALSSWIGVHDLSIMGPRREIHLSGSELEYQDYRSIVTEMQLPVEKRKKGKIDLYFYQKEHSKPLDSSMGM